MPEGGRMPFKNKIRAAAAGVAAIVVTISAVGPAGAASANSIPLASVVGPGLRCSIRTHNGHYLTAVGGGGRTSDVIHTDAWQIGSWELFTFVLAGDPNFFTPYGLLTVNGHYLTVVGAGGRTTDVIHS